MNSHIRTLLKSNDNLKKFFKLVKLGIISKKNACNAIIEERNLSHILDFACEFNDCIETLENVIIETRDISYIYEFASKVQGANILKLEDALIENFKFDTNKFIRDKFCNLYKYINVCKFALLPGADIEKLEDAAIQSRFGECIYSFARDVKGANVKKLQDAIIKYGSGEGIFLFAKDVKGADVLKLEDVCIAHCIYSNGPYNAYKFARDVKGANVKKLEDAVIKYGSSSNIFLFAKDVKGADVLKLEDAVIKTGDAYDIYEFALKVPNADILKLEDAIIKTKCDDYIYKFALNVPNADVLKLEDAIIETGELQYILDFACNVKGTDLSKLEDAVIKYDTLLFGTNIAYLMHKVKEANVVKLRKALEIVEQRNELERIKSYFYNDPHFLKLLTLLVQGEDDAILASKETYAELFEDDKGASRKLEKQ